MISKVKLGEELLLVNKCLYDKPDLRRDIFTLVLRDSHLLILFSFHGFLALMIIEVSVDTRILFLLKPLYLF